MPRRGAACALVPGLGVLLAGGRDAAGEVSTSCSCTSLPQVLTTEVLHLTVRPPRWVEAAPLPGPRPHPALLEVGGGCIVLTSSTQVARHLTESFDHRSVMGSHAEKKAP